MKNYELELNDKFALMLKKIAPQRGQLIEVLTEVLDIDKTAAYRRLRSVIPFTFAEIVRLAAHFGISMDDIVGVSSPYRCQNFRMYWQNYFNLEEVDYKMASDYITAIKFAIGSNVSEFGIAANTFPLHILVQHPNLYRFNILKWMHQFGGSGNRTKYADIAFSERMMELHRSYYKLVRFIKRTILIIDDSSISNLVRDINYFHDIRLISGAERELLRTDIMQVIDNYEKFGLSGKYDTGAEIEIYTSGLSFETTYTYLYSDQIYVSMVDVFSTGSMSSVEKEACEHLRQWLQSLRRASTPLTGSEKNLVIFLEKQRSLIAGM